MKTPPLLRLIHPLLIALTLFFAAEHLCLAAPVKDACSLISPADAQAALGEPVGPARAEDRSFGAGDGSSCRYRSTSGSALSGKSVSLNLRTSETDLTGSAPGMAQNLKSAGFKNVHEVAGIGTAAVWGSNSVLGRSQGELTVIQGKSVTVLVIINGIANEADALARAKTVAAKALARL